MVDGLRCALYIYGNILRWEQHFDETGNGIFHHFDGGSRGGGLEKGKDHN